MTKGNEAEYIERVVRTYADEDSDIANKDALEEIISHFCTDGDLAAAESLRIAWQRHGITEIGG